jgi:hypothetical protein
MTPIMKIGHNHSSERKIHPENSQTVDKSLHSATFFIESLLMIDPGPSAFSRSCGNGGFLLMEKGKEKGTSDHQAHTSCSPWTSEMFQGKENLNDTEIAAKLREQWGALSDAERQPYNDKCARLKSDYNAKYGNGNE